MKLTHATTTDFPDDGAEFTREAGLEGWQWFIEDSLKGYLEQES